MFFQFSPPQKPIKKPTAKKEPEPETAVLSLAPFTANPKIFFENIKVGQTTVQKLIIRNPNNSRLEVSAQIALDEDINLHLNWSQLCLDQHSEDTLDIIWTPKVAGSWRYVLHITDGKRMKRDIPIVLKSISSAKKRAKPSEAKSKGFPRYLAKKTSPIHNLNKKKSPLRRPALPDITNIPDVKIFSPERKFNGKENKLVPDLNFDRRDTFTVNQKISIEPSFDDSLENPPILASSFEDKLKSESFILNSVVTPKNEFLPEHCSTDEKSMNSTSSFIGRKFRLFSENSTFELSPNISNGTFTKNFSNETYTKNISLQNISTETYTKANVSSETYTKHNSSETFTKLNLSSETYTKDLSDRDLTDLATPPSTSKKLRLDSLMGASVKSTIEAGLWSNSRPNRPLLAITEEPSFCDLSTIKQTPIKRKSELTFTIPSKRQNIDGTHITDWSKIMTVSIIDPETALWLENQQDTFKKWLNVVLAPPTDLEAEDQKHPIDVTKLWRECQKKEISIAPVVVSSSRLNFLRKSALILYKSDDIQGVLRKVWAAVDTNRLSVRTDRDVHLDLALQASIMSVLLSYNPLWLRLGLETIYGITIPLKSNNDIIGLTTFLSQRFIRNPALLKKYKSVHSPQYSDAIKKYILKKFLSLIYFLDVAKTRKLIPHDPCLFCKNAPIKESREALINFAREIISSIGDITKYLKHFHYVVEYKQTYLDEFTYTVNCLGVDLRDGVRLTRVMEKILLQKKLSKTLRVPAISRLQKIHNMKIVFDALEKAGFKTLHEILPEDIVNGHKEKTLSFLWQIIYKFQTPLMTKSVTIIAKWWRSDSIKKKREVLRNVRQQKEEAASKIINWYRQIKRRQQEKIRQNQTRAAIKIQSLIKMFLAKRYYQKLKYCVLLVEEKYVARKLMIIEKESFDRFKYAALVIQRRFRANKLAKIQLADYQELKLNVIRIQRLYRQNRIAKIDRSRFLELRSAAIFIQTKWRATILMRHEMDKFEVLKATTIMTQRRFRANLAMRKSRDGFLVLRNSVVFIQRKWKAKLAMIRELEYYQTIRAASIIIQRWYRQNSRAKLEHKNYQHLRENVLFVQRKWRAKIAMKSERDRFEVLKSTTIMIQNKFRANLLMKIHKNYYQNLKASCIIVQRQWRAQLAMRKAVESFRRLKSSTILIQRRWKALKAMEKDRTEFTNLKLAVITIQNRFRAKLAMKTSRENYQQLKSATILLQRKWRAQKAMKEATESFQQLKLATILIQRRWKALKAMKKDRTNFRNLKSAVDIIQNRFKAKLIMKTTRETYQRLKNATILVQRKWRAHKAMKEAFTKFQQLKKASIIIQSRWKALIAMRQEKTSFNILKSSVIITQQRFRANLAMKASRKNYQNLRNATITIQRKWRAQIAMRSHMRKFEQLKKAVGYIKMRWLAKLEMRKAMEKYLKIKTATITIQRRFRANLEMKKQKDEYQKIKTCAICLQKRWRAILEMREKRQQYQQLKKAAILIQRRYREKVIAQLQFTNYQKLKSSAIFVQRRWRSKMTMRRDIKIYQNTRKAAVVIQRRYRECKLAKEAFENFTKLKKATIFVQRLWRLKIAIKLEKSKYEMLKKSTVVIQRRFRANLEMKTQRNDYQNLKRCVILIQTKWRAKLTMRVEREKYEELRNAAITIQSRFRGRKTAKLVLKEFHKLKETTIFVQQKWRALRAMRKELKRYESLKKSTILIQRRFRETVIARQEFSNFQKLKKTVIFVQRKWRGKLLIRAETTQQEFEKLEKAVVFIQRKFRANLLMRIESHRFQLLKKSSIIIQRRYREIVVARFDLENYQKLRNATISIQRRWRAQVNMRRELEKFQVLRNAALTIQRRFRANKLAKLEHANFVNIKKTVIVMQKYSRGFLIRRQYAQFLTPEAIAQRKLLRVQSKAAIKIQSAWKGYKIRSTNKPTLLKIYEKLKKANQNALPEKTLGSRCKKAIAQLSKGNSSLREILLVLHDLDFITRRCSQSLKKLGPVLPKHLYEIIKSTNRSPPEIEVSTVAASILINFYRYEPTRVHTWIPEYINSVMTVMLHCCDKETPLFPTLCTLMWFFARNEDYRNAIISTHKCREKIMQIKDKCERKVKMIRRMSINYTSYFDKNEKLPLPTVTPDWGLNYDNKPRIFPNSVQALNCVLSVLKF